MEKIIVIIDVNSVRRLCHKPTQVEKPKKGKGSYSRKNRKKQINDYD